MFRSRDEILAKTKKMEKLQSKINTLESFAPLQTSSQQHITITTDTSTQTSTDRKPDKQSAYGHDGENSLITMHIQEMRELRKQLEETRKNNDALRRQLEDRLSQVERDARRLNDPQLKVTLIRDNDAMRAKLSESEASIERMKLRIDELTTEKQRYVD